jgi:hypothetical protein
MGFKFVYLYFGSFRLFVFRPFSIIIFRLIRLVSSSNSAFFYYVYFIDYLTNSFIFGQKNRPIFSKFCVVFLYQLLSFSLD